MSDRKGNPDKQTEACREKGVNACENLKEASGPTDFDGETYNCAVCGEHFRLYYEDMA